MDLSYNDLFSTQRAKKNRNATIDAPIDAVAQRPTGSNRRDVVSLQHRVDVEGFRSNLQACKCCSIQCSNHILQDPVLFTGVYNMRCNYARQNYKENIYTEL